MPHLIRPLPFFLIFSFFVCVATAQAAVDHAYGIALHGTPKYPANFTHLDYVNPDAPKNGTVHVSVIGSFDSTHPYILKGQQAAGMGMVYETLMESTTDEANSAYGLLAETIGFPDDKSWVSFTLRPHAKFSDGTPVTPEDVIWSFETLKTKGHPFYRSYYNDVAKVEKTGSLEIKFTFSKAGNTELPMIMGQLPILPKQDWQTRKFEETTLDKLIGSGPYLLNTVDVGKSVSFVKNENWWGKDLPINKGRYNFDRIQFDYYRDATVAHEALLAGKFDYKLENIAKVWATAYDAPVITKGLIKKEEIKNELPNGMQAFAYNIRRPLFSDPRVREAVAYTFDFEWSNKNFAFGSYNRTRSYFQNSELAATDLPSPDELALLEPLRASVPVRAFTSIYAPPQTAGDGNIRENMRRASSLLTDAGWTLKNKILTNAKGEAFTFEILVDSPAFERWVLPFIKNLERLGIKARLRVVDTAQYQNRLNDFDFDMIVQVFPQSLSPGNEQRDFWHSSKANVKGSRNIIGIQDPAIDALVEKIIAAKDRAELITACRALDRVLQWNFYVIPHWHTNVFRVAAWDIFGRPAINPPYGLPILETWWIDADKYARIRKNQK